MTRKPATSAAEYAERTRDENKQRELHPHDTGSLDLTAMRTMPRVEARRVWAAASDADKRGLAIQCIRHGNHGPDEATIAMYLDILEGQLGLSPIDRSVAGALERLADSHQRSAETAETSDERVYFRRWAGAFRKALLFYLQGARPEQAPCGSWLVMSASRFGQVHQVERSGQCTCEAQNRGCWHSALVTGIETGYDDLTRLGADDGATVPEDQGPDDFSDVDPVERAPRLDSPATVASLVQRLTAARAKIAA
jgi:hypothetical protein